MIKNAFHFAFLCVISAVAMVFFMIIGFVGGAIGGLFLGALVVCDAFVRRLREVFYKGEYGDTPPPNNKENSDE